MTSAEQKRLIEALKYKTGKMLPKDKYDYEMFMKRDKDDEDLDSLSMKRLESLPLNIRGRSKLNIIQRAKFKSLPKASLREKPQLKSKTHFLNFWILTRSFKI